MNVVTLKLTPEECDLLDALVTRTKSECRSVVIRDALRDVAERFPALDIHLRRANQSREGITSRRRKIRDPKPRQPKPSAPPKDPGFLMDILDLVHKSH